MFLAFHRYFQAQLKWSESRSVVSNSLRPHGLYSPRNSPGQNTGVGRLFLLQRIFPTQGSNPGLPHCRQILYQLSHKGSPCSSKWWPNWEIGIDIYTLLYIECCLVAKSCPSLCKPMDYSPLGSIVYGISQARILEWVPFPSPTDIPNPGTEPEFPALAGRFFTTEPSGKPHCIQNR